MNETDVAIVAKRKVYRARSRVLLVIVLLLLVVVGVILPLFYTPRLLRIYHDMGAALPTITQYVINCTQQVISFGLYLLLAIGFLGTILVVKEILAPPKVRYWVNVVTLLLLLIWGLCYVCVVSLPMWGMIRAMQGS